jgi:hypothetical protein
MTIEQASAQVRAQGVVDNDEVNRSVFAGGCFV